jgi:hypothetical protein
MTLYPNTIALWVGIRNVDFEWHTIQSTVAEHWP